jgi:hypothetical protein
MPASFYAIALFERYVKYRTSFKGRMLQNSYEAVGLHVEAEAATQYAQGDVGTAPNLL